MKQLLIALLASVSLAACSSTRHPEYPAPGKLIDIGTHRMHLYCRGEGSPTIVLESGAGIGVSAWQKIQEPLSRLTRTCSYDRSGLVWSEKRTELVSARQVASELKLLLEAAKEPGPYVLVAASLGGIFARKYIEDHPGDVSGLVLVDAAHPDQLELMPKHFRGGTPRIMRNTVSRKTVGLLLSLTGLDEKMLRKSFVTMPKAVTDLNIAFLPHSLPTILEEVTEVPAILREVDKDQDFGQMPVYVIAADLQYQPAYGLNAQYDAAELAEAYRVARQLQQELLLLSTDSSLVVAEQSGHNVNFEQAQIVITTVEALLNKLLIRNMAMLPAHSRGSP